MLQAATPLHPMRSSSRVLGAAVWANRRLRRPPRVAWLFWLAGVLWLALPVAIPVNPDRITFDGGTILVSFQETTGPSFRVDRGDQALRDATIEQERLRRSDPIVAMLNSTEVGLLGKNPGGLVSYGCLSGTSWVISGHVVGLTARWSDAFSGVVPLFWVERYRPTEYCPNFVNRAGILSLAVHLAVLLGLPVLALGSLSFVAACVILRRQKTKEVLPPRRSVAG